MDLPDYSEYVFGIKEKLFYVSVAMGIIIAAAVLCYDNLLFAVFLSPYVPLYLKKKGNQLKEDRKWKLNLQFGECIECISSALESGYSVENAIVEAYKDMKLSYGENDYIMIEMEAIRRAVLNSIPIEDAFGTLASRSGLEDIRSFADIFITAKRTGGNIIGIIRTTSGIIRTRVEMKRDIKTIISGKKLEADIMKALPVFMLVYLRIFSPDMIKSLYGNISGMLLMTVLLVVYLFLCRISDRMVKIEI